MSTGIMIIGPSGSGKTTLGKIVARNWDIYILMWMIIFGNRIQIVHIHKCIRGKKRLAD